MKDVVDMYKGFLEGIDKGSTVVVRVQKWNQFINLVALDWLDKQIGLSKVGAEVNPDLESLHIDLDGVSYRPIAPKAGFGGEEFLFELPRNDSMLNTRNHDGVIIPTMVGDGDDEIPEFYHIKSVLFKIIYGSGWISDWLPAREMHASRRGFIMLNPYERPLDTRLYYEIIEGYIRLSTGKASGLSESAGYSMRLGFYKKLDVMEIDVQSGSIVRDVVLTQKTRKEIVDKAIRIYLERKMNPRYKTYLQEMVIKERAKI